MSLVKMIVFFSVPMLPAQILLFIVYLQRDFTESCLFPCAKTLAFLDGLLEAWSVIPNLGRVSANTQLMKVKRERLLESS